MHRTHLLLALVLLFAVACSPIVAPDLPTNTPRATATPLPSATPPPTRKPAPPPTATPPPSAGYYRNPELGFWFLYPEEWAKEETRNNLPSVIISDNDDPVQLLAGGRILEDGTELADFARAVGEEMGLGEDIELVDDGPTSLSDGTPAWRVAFAWEDEKGRAFRAEGLATISGGKGYVLLMVAQPNVLATRQRTLQTIGNTLHLEEPELFGISRTNALVLLIEDPVTLDPALTDEGPAGIVGHVFGGLVRLNADLRIDPDLAESWDVSEDGTEYTFHLHPDAQFHSGSPLTAADVKASWERATDPDIGSPTAALYLGDIVGVGERLAGEADAIAGVEVTDDQTLVVTVDGPKPYFLAKLAQPVAFVTQVENAADGPTWWRRPDGSGPFVLHRWEEGDFLIVKQNEEYHGTPPSVSAVIYYLSSSSGLAAYEAGQLDAATVAPANLSRAQDPADPLSADLLSGNTFCTYRVVFDATRAPFDDPLIRKAFSLAVNRTQLADVVLHGAASPATGFLPPGMPGSVTRSVDESFNVDAALDLIAESDYGSASALPSLTFTSPGESEPDPVAVALSDMWSTHLGVAIKTELLEPSGYTRALATEGGHIHTHQWCAAYADPENVLDLPYHSSGPANLGGYANAELDALLEKARTELNPGKRLEYYQETESLLLEHVPAIPIVYPGAHVLIRPYIRGYNLSPIPVLWPAFVTIERQE